MCQSYRFFPTKDGLLNMFVKQVSNPTVELKCWEKDFSLLCLAPDSLSTSTKYRILALQYGFVTLSLTFHPFRIGENFNGNFELLLFLLWFYSLAITVQRGDACGGIPNPDEATFQKIVCVQNDKRHTAQKRAVPSHTCMTQLSNGLSYENRKAH